MLPASRRILSLSLAHKRWAQGEAGKAVLDGEAVTARAVRGRAEKPGITHALPERAHALPAQPRADPLRALYQGWMRRLARTIKLAERHRTLCAMADTPRNAPPPDDTLCATAAQLEAQIAALRAAAAKETQTAPPGAI